MKYEEILNKLENKENFSLSRWGDGEFNCMSKMFGTNCDGHQYFEDLGTHLNTIYSSKPDYTVLVQPLARELYSIEEDYENADVFHNASIEEKLERFFKVLNKRKYVILVGPSYLNVIHGNYFNVCTHISIPERDCWLQYPKIRYMVETVGLTGKDFVFLFAASMMSNVLIDEMHRTFKGNHTFIDIGSALDPYAGYITRYYHQQLGLNTWRKQRRIK